AGTRRTASWPARGPLGARRRRGRRLPRHGTGACSRRHPRSSGKSSIEKSSSRCSGVRREGHAPEGRGRGGGAVPGARDDLVSSGGAPRGRSPVRAAEGRARRGGADLLLRDSEYRSSRPPPFQIGKSSIEKASSRCSGVRREGHAPEGRGRGGGAVPGARDDLVSSGGAPRGRSPVRAAEGRARRGGADLLLRDSEYRSSRPPPF